MPDQGFIPVNEPDLTGNERNYLNACIDTGWISSEGPFIREFEQRFAARVGRKHGVAVCNGSVALDAAAKAVGIGPGDEVIMPTFTIISCSAAVSRLGGTPVVVDCDAATWNMDVSRVEERITPRTKAIMPVHIYGLPVDMDPLLDIAKRHNLPVIEDAAEMIGQNYRDRPCGSFGIISTFSFYPNKHVTTGEGGMILTDDDDIAEHLRGLRNLAMKPERRFIHDEIGWNFRMTNMQAAIGLAQLERLDEFVARKRRMFERYSQMLSDISCLQLPLKCTEYAMNINWVYGVIIADDVAFDAAEAMKRLGQKGIGTRPFFWPIHEQPVYLKEGLFKDERYPNAERIARRGFYLPSGLTLTDSQLERVSDAVHEVFG
jgi:perosamine synthetase